MAESVKILIDDISEKSEVASVQQKAAGEKKAYLDKQSVIIEREEAEAAEALKAAIPALEAAKAALANINKPALDEIKALAQPPATIQDVCTICFFLYPKTSGNPDWLNVKTSVLSDTKLIDNLKFFEVSKLKADGANKAKKKMEKIIKELGCSGTELGNLIKTTKNVATGALYNWCDATL